MAVVVHFEDRGQDFLRWTIRDGIVVKSSGQDWLWKHTRVLGTPCLGEKLKIQCPVSETETEVRYRVIQIDEMPDLVECVECGSEVADPGRGVRCEAEGENEQPCGGRLVPKEDD